MKKVNLIFFVALHFCVLFSLQAKENISNNLKSKNEIKCTTLTKLKSTTKCHEGEIIDCTKPVGRTAYFICKSSDLMFVESEIDAYIDNYLKKNIKNESLNISKLIDLQKKWKSNVREECEYLSSITSGNDSPLLELDCIIKNYKFRLNHMQNYY